jgi:hypothetical protein
MPFSIRSSPPDSGVVPFSKEPSLANQTELWFLRPLDSPFEGPATGVLHHSPPAAVHPSMKRATKRGENAQSSTTIAYGIS